MTTTKEAMIAKYGSEDAYRAHMREIRAKVTSHPGGSFRDKKFAKLMAKRSHDVRGHKNALKDSDKRLGSPQEEQS